MGSESHNLSRRAFLWRGALATGGSVLMGAWTDLGPAGPDASEAVHYGGPGSGDLALYLDESGDRVRGSAVLGALASTDPHRHQMEIRGLRRQVGFFGQLRYSSSNRYQMPFAEALAYYFASESHLRFTADVLHRTERTRRLVTDGAGVEGRAYTTTVRKNPHRGRLFVHVEHRSLSDGGGLLHSYLERELAGDGTRVYLVDSARDELIQLAGFLTGVVYAELNPPREGVKLGFLDSLRAALDSPRLIGSSGIRAGGFRVEA